MLWLHGQDLWVWIALEGEDTMWIALKSMFNYMYTFSINPFLSMFMMMEGSLETHGAVA